MATRRDLLIAGVAVGATVSVAPVLRAVWPFDFEPLAGHPGYRRLATPMGVTPNPALVGLGPAPDKALVQDIAAARTDLDAALGYDRVGALPLVVFTDFNCPSCRALEAWLLPWAETAAIDLRMRDLPLLGPGSARAARAMVTADLLGLGAKARPLLTHRGIRPGSGALTQLATEIGAQAQAFVALHDGPKPDRMLRKTAAVAAVIGVIGTPTLMIGRTMVTGALDKRGLRRLVALEQDRFFA